MVRWMAFNSCPGYQLNKRWKNDKIEVLEGKTFYAINTKTCGTQKKMDDKMKRTFNSKQENFMWYDMFQTFNEMTSFE